MATFRRLDARADVLVMNMSVDAVESLAVRYRDLRDANPGLIYLNLFAFGSEGPYRSFRTWGGNLSAISGLTASVGWPDRLPTGLPLSFPDYPSSMWGVIAVLAALLRRDREGTGWALELAQLQVAIECLGPIVSEAVLTGVSPPRTGASSRRGAPDGIFATSDDRRYVAVSVTDDDAWCRLADVDGLDELARDPAYATAAARVASRAQIGAQLARWTSARTAWEATWRLQEAGVAAFPVVDAFDVLRDEHLAARRFFRALPHARFDAELCYGQAVTLSDTPASFTRAAPAFGEHTREVLAEIGLDDAEVEAMLASGVAHEMTYRDVKLARPFYGWIDKLVRLPWPPGAVDPAGMLFARLDATYGGDR
jgi:crotonobetainyl-CoA:carnitine CoA-transferase CaiB-like acyl-CoA transferase